MNLKKYKERKTLPYFEKALERDAILFKWKSNDPEFKIPFQPEMILTIFGSLGYDKIHKCWVIGAFNEIRDEYGDYSEFIGHTLATENVQNYVLKNHEEVIVCGNTPLFRPFNEERSFYAMMKEETDKSIKAQLINSRLNKAFMADSDNKKKQIEKAYEAFKEGFPMIIVTGLLEGLDTVDLTDPDDIEKMQYLSSFYQSLEKREANDFGVDLENIDKKAQVTSEEIRQYNDVTSLEYLIMWEMRQNFVEEMKENGFDIEIIRNPIFFDEPTAKDVNEGTFEEAEAETPEAPQEGEEAPKEPETPEEGGEENGN